MNTFVSNNDPMNVLARRVRGDLRFVIDTTVGGKRKRHYFKTRTEANQALSVLRKDRADLGRAWGSLSAREKSNIMRIVTEVKEAGWTLEGVWKAAQSIPSAPKSGCALGQAVLEVLAAKADANCRPRHIGNLKWYLGLFSKGRETTDVRSIGVRELEDWFTARNESPRSKKGHVSLLSTLFEHCWRKRYITENPIKRLDPVHIDRHTPATFTWRQCAKALIFAKRRRPNLLGWLALTLFCGLRPDSEADFIDWKDIDIERGRIVIGRSKVRLTRPRIIDLSFCPPAVEWLRIAKELKSPLPIHFQARRRAIRALRSYLQLPRWPQDVLRHTAASNLLAYHQDAGKVAAFLGNSAGVLLRDYKALIFKEDADRFMALKPPNIRKPVLRRLVTPDGRSERIPIPVSAVEQR